MEDHADVVADLQRQLRLAEARFAGIVEIAADAVISIDEEQVIRLFNEGAEQIFGYKAEEVLGRPLEVLLPERFRASHRAHVAGFGAGQERARRMGHRREISGLRRGGEEFPAEASISKYQVGDALTYNVVLRDITERKRVEDQQRFLARAGEVLAASLDYDRTVQRAVRLAVPALGEACVVELIKDGVFRGVAVAHSDPAKEEQLGEMRRRYPPDPEGPHPLAQVLRTRAATVVDLSDELLASMTRGPAHLAMVRAFGWRSAVFVPLLVRDSGLGVLSLYDSHRRYGRDDLVLAEDFGRRIALAIENARLYDAAQRAVRARDETVAVVSHDLRNPVSAISMLAGNLLDTLDGAASGDGRQSLGEYLQVIRQAAGQADALIQDLLDISRIEAGRLRIDPHPEDMSAIVDAAVDVLGPLAAERSLELRADVADALPRVYVDGERIHQVLSNLVGNAVKFTPAGGRIMVGARRAADEVVVSVSDTGAGVPAEHLPHVFDRYWQANRPTRGGAGLGLAIAKGIIEAHGGRIWVESRLGEGSTFYFSVPAAG